MKIHLNTRHLIEQAADSKRIPHFDGKPFRLTVSHLNRWKEAIEQNAPDDWRFTERGRDFVLTVITGSHQIKFVGKSWRWTRRAQEIANGVNRLARDLENTKEPENVFLAHLANLYLDAECDTQAGIHHELKSVLGAHMATVSDLARTAKEEEEDESIVLAQSRVHRNLAQRPNAILIDVEGQPLELWVRQGNPYVRLFKGSQKSHSFCILAKLTPAGITEGTGQIWKVSSGGVVCHIGNAWCSTTPHPEVGSVPRGFRSENYWRLPLHLDTWRHELEYKWKKEKQKSQGPAPETVHLLAAINLVRQRAKTLNRELSAVDRRGQ